MTSVVEDLARDGYFIQDGFLTPELCRALEADLGDLHRQGALKASAIGRGATKQVQDRIRGDRIFWLDEDQSTPAQKEFWLRMNDLRQDLNRNFFLGLQRLEAHFAWYAPGTGYEKHLDQHAGTRARQVTFILYLNSHWTAVDGGELLLFDPANEEKVLRKIEPLDGRLVLFRSEMFPHQVSPSFADRKSLTGWFRNDALS